MSAKANCPRGKMLAILRWVNGQRILVVGCDDCQEEVHLVLSEFVSALGPEEDASTYILPDNGRVH